MVVSAKVEMTLIWLLVDASARRMSVETGVKSVNKASGIYKNPILMAVKVITFFFIRRHGG